MISNACFNKDGTIDYEMLDTVVKNEWALKFEWKLWLQYNRWFEVLRPKKYLIYKKI